MTLARASKLYQYKLIDIADAFDNSGDQDRARDCRRRASEAASEYGVDWSSVGNDARGYVLNEIVEKQLAAGDVADARKSAERIADGPLSFTTYCRRESLLRIAEFHFSAGDKDKANQGIANVLKSLTEANYVVGKEERFRMECYRDIVNSYLAMDDIEGAKALASQITHSEIKRYVMDDIACAQARLGDIAAAKRHIEFMDRESQTNRRQVACKIYRLAGASHLDAGNPEKAQEAITQAYRLAEKPEEYVQVAELHLRAGDVEEARGTTTSYALRPPIYGSVPVGLSYRLLDLQGSVGYVDGARYTIRWITKCPDDLVTRMFQLEGLSDDTELDHDICTKVENFCYLTQQAIELREKQVIVDFEGFLSDQKGGSSEDSSWALIRAAGDLKDAIKAKGIERPSYDGTHRVQPPR